MGFLKYIFSAFIFLLIVSGGILAQDTSESASSFSTDTTIVDVRIPQESTLEEYRNNDDFDYSIDLREGENWFQDLINWILRKLLFFIFDESEGSYGKLVLYMVFAVIVIFIAYQLTNTRIGSFFFRSATILKPGTGVSEEELIETDYEGLIRDAVENGRYRYAVRLLYLKLLKKMTVSGMIKWRQDKTNSDYVREISESGLRSDFSLATMHFEYIWYGDFPVDKEMFSRINERVSNLEKKVGRV